MRKVEPYYKKNGFFDRLEKISDWIDWGIWNFRWRIEESIDDFKSFGFMYFIPEHFSTVANKRYWLEAELEAPEVKTLQADVVEVK